ncbi:MAG: MFS transporter [Chloroflexi bacterium]|nr:MFS transporter [Chloroflexota bacterium]
MKSAHRYHFSPAVTVILIFGIISLLGDMVYEGARSANSQYFSLLSISAAQIGLVFGIGEFLGYALRLLAGVLSDKTGRHWVFLFVGYGMLLVVPLMGVTGQWNVLVVLLLMERIGKALRNPAKDTIVSSVAENQVGIGFAFGLQEALDQLGAFSGPLIFSLTFILVGSNNLGAYQLGYRWLLLPFVLLMLFLVYAWQRIRRERLIKHVKVREFRHERLSRLFWFYTAFTFFASLGLVNFALIGFHLKANRLLSDANITLLYAVAMGVDALVALAVGRYYDRAKARSGHKTGGLIVLLVVPLLTALIPFFALTRSVGLAVLGMVLFGAVMGIHETIMRSAIADLTPFYKRGTGYGVFHLGYGLAFLVGAAAMGWLYDRGLIALIFGLVLVSEAVAALVFYRMRQIALREAEYQPPAAGS